jgi:hypothetical protein
MSLIKTNEGSLQYDGTLNNYVDFFSKAGSIFSKTSRKRQMFYNNEQDIVEMFRNVWSSGDQLLAMKLLFWLRDPRNGAGNRSGFRDCLRWLVETDVSWIEINIDNIIEYGRWDDLRVLFNTAVEEVVYEKWAKEIANGNGLASKWADRSDLGLLKRLRKTKHVKTIQDFRRLLAKGRSTVVETKMCSKKFNEIEYTKVPSMAMNRYSNAFKRNDEQRFTAFKEAVEKGETKINSSVIFPHNLMRSLRGGGDRQTIDLQFTSMPNFMKDNGDRIMVLCDSSGSMECDIGGGVQAIDISTSLSLYCSDRIPTSSPFHKKFIQFESESTLTDWNGMSFSEAYEKRLFDGAIGSTRIDIALDSILNFAKMFKVDKDNMPNMLMVISDMQFDEGIESETPVVEASLNKWVEAGYDIPKILYWNVAGYAGSPATANMKNVALVSGFSPSILEAVFSGEDFSPKAIMLRKLENYNVNIPSNLR